MHEVLLDSITHKLVPIRRKQLRAQERRSVEDIVFLRLHRPSAKLEIMNAQTDTYPLIKLSHPDLDGRGLLIMLRLVQADLLLDDLAKQEREQLLVIARLGEVLAEALHSSSQRG